MHEQNLLLRQQVIKRLGNFDLNFTENTSEDDGYEQELSNYVLPTDAPLEGDLTLGERCEELKILLANIQLGESATWELLKTQIDTFDRLEQMSEHVVNHIDCTILEIKSARNLFASLKTYGEKEHCITEELSIYLERFNENNNLSSLETSREQLLTTLTDNNSLKKLHNEFEEKRSNYKLALKNFKIILEILNVNEESLVKLKRQFDEVLMDYQHCRCVLHQQLPLVIATRTKILVDSLNCLEANYDMMAGERAAFNDLLKVVAAGMQGQEYMLLKKNS